MVTCPRCHQPVDKQAVRCPYCRNELKAFGHPGIPLHQAIEDNFLCKSCLYDQDNTCNFPQRPYAKSCTIYHNKNKPLITESPKPNVSKMIRFWVQRNRGLILLIGVILICVVLALK